MFHRNLGRVHFCVPMYSVFFEPENKMISRVLVGVVAWVRFTTKFSSRVRTYVIIFRVFTVSRTFLLDSAVVLFVRTSFKVPFSTRTPCTRLYTIRIPYNTRTPCTSILASIGETLRWFRLCFSLSARISIILDG